MHFDTIEFCKLVSSYLNVYLPELRGLSKNTIKSYRATLGQFVDYLTKTNYGAVLCVESISRESVIGFLDDCSSRGCSVSTRNQKLAAISAFVKYCASKDISHSVVVAEVAQVPRKKTVSKPVGYLNEECLRALLCQPDIKTNKGLRDATIMSFIYDTAARASEVLSLKCSDLYLDDKSPRVTLWGKGDKVRTVPLMEATVKTLRVYLDLYHPNSQKRIDWLFYTIIKGKAGAMSYENLAKMIAKYASLAKSGCPTMPEHVRPHMLRHTRAMHLYEDGVPLSYIKDLLGHSNINTTSIYASASLDMLRTVINGSTRNIKTSSPLPAWESEVELLKKMATL